MTTAELGTELGQDRDVPCAYPPCPGLGEPEQDGDHRYYTCRECGDDFGWSQVSGPTMQDKDSCAAGIPVAVRKAASAPMEVALVAAKAAPVPLTIGFGRPRR